MNLRQIRSVKGTVALFVVALVVVVALLVLWNVVLAVDFQRIRELATRDEQRGVAFHWTFIGLGSALFVAAIALLSVLGARLIGEIRESQRMSRFIATFTHELNSPLASIKLFAQTLQRPGLPPAEQARFLALILEDVERLRGQISNVLRAAQADGPLGLQVAPEPLDLNAWLADYVDARRPGLDRDGRVRLEFEAGPPAEVRFDRSLLRQVVDNLLDNAVKYGRRDGVRVQVLVLEGSTPDRVAVEFRDDGTGVREQDLARIFDRLGRGERGAGAQTAGTGLGLWVVRSAVEAHGGMVWATSPGLDRGTTIRLELPSLASGEALAAAGDRAGAAA